MAKYGIATVFESLEVGYEFSQDNIPLHLTHVDSFQVELGADELASLLSTATVDQPSIDIKATKDAYYGPEKDILVTEIDLIPALSLLHSLIMKMLIDSNAVLKNPHFHIDGYSTHISVYGTRRVHPSDILTIDNLVVAAKTSDAEDAMTRILAKITL